MQSTGTTYWLMQWATAACTKGHGELIPLFLFCADQVFVSNYLWVSVWTMHAVFLTAVCCRRTGSVLEFFAAVQYGSPEDCLWLKSQEKQCIVLGDNSHRSVSPLALQCFIANSCSATIQDWINSVANCRWVAHVICFVLGIYWNKSLSEHSVACLIN